MDKAIINKAENPLIEKNSVNIAAIFKTIIAVTNLNKNPPNVLLLCVLLFSRNIITSNFNIYTVCVIEGTFM